VLGMTLLKAYKAVLPGEGLEAGATDGENFDLCECCGAGTSATTLGWRGWSASVQTSRAVTARQLRRTSEMAVCSTSLRAKSGLATTQR
jgi:hypothetical protein